jgi:hypothetical protein
MVTFANLDAAVEAAKFKLDAEKHPVTDGQLREFLTLAEAAGLVSFGPLPVVPDTLVSAPIVETAKTEPAPAAESAPQPASPAA